MLMLIIQNCWHRLSETLRVTMLKPFNSWDRCMVCMDSQLEGSYDIHLNYPEHQLAAPWLLVLSRPGFPPRKGAVDINQWQRCATCSLLWGFEINEAKWSFQQPQCHTQWSLTSVKINEASFCWTSESTPTTRVAVSAVAAGAWPCMLIP